MKQYLYLVLCLSFLIITSCKSDSPPTEEVTEEKVEDLAEDLLEQEMALVEELSADEADDGAVANEVEVELEEVNIDQAKQLEQKKEILKEQLKESPNLGKDCNSILKEYSDLVDKYVSGEDKDAVITQLAKWANDPIYNKCKKDPEYRDQFYDLEEKMYADEEEEF